MTIDRIKEILGMPFNHFWEVNFVTRLLIDEARKEALRVMHTLEKQNEILRSQLTYRDVSEKPEKSGWYFCKVKTPYSDKLGNNVFFSTTVGWICSFDETVVKWLPIPKE